MELIFTCLPEEKKKLEDEGIIKTEGSDFSIDINDQIKLMRENKLAILVHVNGEPILWNPVLEPDPRVYGNSIRGNKESGFKWSPFYSTKGKYLQEVVKLGIIKAIEIAHKQIFTYYDNEAYKFDDERLTELNIFFRTFIAQNFENPRAKDARKLSFMYQFVDILLFLMKEDVYYRPRFFKLFNEIPKFQLTDVESENIERWH